MSFPKPQAFAKCCPKETFTQWLEFFLVRKLISEFLEAKLLQFWSYMFSEWKDHPMLKYDKPLPPKGKAVKSKLGERFLFT
jgi:hypothetical protein